MGVAKGGGMTRRRAQPAPPARVAGIEAWRILTARMLADAGARPAAVWGQLRAELTAMALAEQKARTRSGPAGAAVAPGREAR